jgi:hypothetical protein
MDNQNKTANSGLFSAGAPAPIPAPEAVVSEPKVEVTEEMKAQERELLMSRARLMGIEFSNNIGTDTLRERINKKLDEPETSVVAPVEAKVGAQAPNPLAPAGAEINALTGQIGEAPKKSLRETIYDEQMKLVRVRITCMDPKKKDLQGEVLTVANEYLGTVRKFVPFGEATEGGYHIPYCIYTMLKEREFLNIRTTKDPRTGLPRVESNYAKEFAIDVMDPLTPDELNRLATAQAAAGSIG